MRDYDALGIYDRISMLSLRMSNLTFAALMMQAGVCNSESGADVSSGCLGVLYVMLDNAAEELNSIILEYSKFLDNEMGDTKNEV